MNQPGFRRMLQKICMILVLSESINAFTTSHLGKCMPQNVQPQTHHRFRSPCLLSSPSPNTDSEAASSVRFLGRGSNAIVRPGVVLIAPSDEFHHFMRESAVFIYAMGLDDADEYVIRGVIIDHPTAFTIGEMMDGVKDDVNAAPVFSNLLYRGGDMGGESAFMLHSDEEIAKMADQDMVGTSGIYQGGLEYAVSSSDFDTKKAKFFFHFLEFTEQELENMLVDSESDGDGWVSVEIPSNMVLSSEYDRGDAWARLRNVVREYK
ncbi:MAG: hypothetical protein SGBAC_010432 [Bacillariaceae sp.]